MELGGDWGEDDVGEALLGTVVYSSDEPFRILESSSSPTAAKRDFAEYGADLGEAFGSDRARESRRRGGGDSAGS